MPLNNPAGGAPLTVQDEAAGVVDAAVTTLRVPDGRLFANVAGDVSLVEQFPNLGVGRLYCAIQERLACAAGNTVTLANIAGQGWITEIWIAISSAAEATRMDSLLQIYIDGEGVASIDHRIAALSCSSGSDDTIHFQNNRIGKPEHSAARSQSSHFHRLVIPFTTGIRVDFANPGGGAAAVLWSMVSYHLGARVWDRHSRLRAAYTLGAAPVAYAAQDLLNIAGRGVLHGLFLLIDGGDANFNYLEGNIEIYVDGEGVASYSSSGTEDFFRTSHYAPVGEYYVDDYGLVRRDAVGFMTVWYRFFTKDPVEFDTSLQIVWYNGEVVAAPVVNASVVDALAWYYTDA